MSAPVTSEPIMLRQQVNTLPAYVLAAWRSRYVPVDGVDLEARAMLNQEAATVRADGVQPDALTVWMHFADQVVRVGSPSGTSSRRSARRTCGRGATTRLPRASRHEAGHRRGGLSADHHCPVDTMPKCPQYADTARGSAPAGSRGKPR